MAETTMNCSLPFRSARASCCRAPSKAYLSRRSGQSQNNRSWSCAMKMAGSSCSQPADGIPFEEAALSKPSPARRRPLFPTQSDSRGSTRRRTPPEEASTTRTPCGQEHQRHTHIVMAALPTARGAITRARPPRAWDESRDDDCGSWGFITIPDPSPPSTMRIPGFCRLREYAP
jgi:hypothetical protein